MGRRKDRPGVPLPVAFLASYVHARMSAQRSCFTVHGKKEESLKDLLEEVTTKILVEYRIELRYCDDLRRELETLGIGWSTALPDLEGLAKELKELFRPDLLKTPSTRH